MPLEERVYRFRCVEAWSMVVPWVGFEFNKLAAMVKPTSNAKYVKFTTAEQKETMTGLRLPYIDFPYVEGLRIDEAMHPLTLLTVGLYGETLPNQNGAPVRLIVPWKYGFKSGKSIVRIEFVEEQPTTTWMLAGPSEYGFYSNVNPAVDHPRWSQRRERVLPGLFASRQTETFNGYARAGRLALRRHGPEDELLMAVGRHRHRRRGRRASAGVVAATPSRWRSRSCSSPVACLPALLARRGLVFDPDVAGRQSGRAHPARDGRLVPAVPADHPRRDAAAARSPAGTGRSGSAACSGLFAFAYGVAAPRGLHRLRPVFRHVAPSRRTSSSGPSSPSASPRWC